MSAEVAVRFIGRIGCGRSVSNQWPCPWPAPRVGSGSIDRKQVAERWVGSRPCPYAPPDREHSAIARELRPPAVVVSARRCRRAKQMPILILIILVILVAQIGFWDTFTAILGAVGVIILLLVLAGALVVLTALYLLRRARAR